MPELVCWKCGYSLAALSLPLQRTDDCRQCGAALKTCKLCEFYDVTKAKHCREPIAEEVREKDRANYCDYFKPRPGAYSNEQPTVDAARNQLDALFGAATAAPPPTSQPRQPDRQKDADEARKRLDELFKKG